MLIRIAVFALVTVAGFAFPLLFLLAALIGWSILADLNDPRQNGGEAPPRSHRTVSAADADWKSYFSQHCDSPAETAFLDAMVEAHGLLPENGILKGRGLILDLQVEIRPYRVDFLADEWLVIEIDGVAYHSSPEAQARDRTRDQILEESGFRVLRIPARTVFDTPNKAIEAVRSAIAAGRVRAVETVARPAPRMGLRGGLASIGMAIDKLDTFVTRASAVQAAMIEPHRVFSTEKAAIEGAPAHAESELKTAEFRARSVEHAKQFDEAMNRFEALLAHHRPPTDVSQPSSMAVPALRPPPPHDDPTIDEAIQQAYRTLLRDRGAFFDDVQRRLRADARNSELVREYLEDWECPELWLAISSHSTRANSNGGGSQGLASS